MESTLRKGSREKNCKINQPNSSWKGDHAALGSIGTHITHSLEAGLSRDALLMCIMQILFVDTKRFFCKGGAYYGYTRNTRRENNSFGQQDIFRQIEFVNK